jgi:hypothetical protein
MALTKVSDIFSLYYRLYFLSPSVSSSSGWNQTIQPMFLERYVSHSDVNKEITSFIRAGEPGKYDVTWG